MSQPLVLASFVAAVMLSACSADEPRENRSAANPAEATAAPVPSGERLIYVIGCVNCHHQTPKEIINAPPLTVAQAYSLPEFQTLLASGVTRDGRDLYAKGSIMGIVAREQLSYLTGPEVAAIHSFLNDGWTSERASAEEAKIAKFPNPARAGD